MKKENGNGILMISIIIAIIVLIIILFIAMFNKSNKDNEELFNTTTKARENQLNYEVYDTEYSANTVKAVEKLIENVERNKSK